MIFLDIETTGIDPNVNKILSLGIIYYDKVGESDSAITREFYKELEFDINDPNFSDEAKKINAKLISSPERKYPAILVESEAIKFIQQYTNEKFKVPVGYNISSFDMIFIKNYMPDLYNFLGYRSMCLNALISFYSIKTGESFWAVKQAIKDIVTKRGFTVTHNALDDCRQSLETYKVLDELFIAKV